MSKVDKLSRQTYITSTACRAFLAIILLAFSLGGNAQTPKATTRVDQLSDEQVVEFFRRAQASGLTEIQIEQAAMSQGYTLDDIAKMRRRINQIRSKSSGNNGQSGQAVGDTGIVRKLPGDLSRRIPFDSLLLPKKDTIKKPVVFGASLFQNASLSFEPNLRIATPRNYIVGPDDEIVLDIYGASSDNFRLKVSPEGTVKIQNLAPIFVSGLTIEQAEQRIIGRLRQAYSTLNRPGSGTYANISLGNIRSIRVTLVGEVMRPGTYTISSLASAFNALYLAGGPNPETGSFRRISVVRGNRVIRTIDLYDFLLRADQKDNIRLQDQDVIRVADYQTRVEMAGEVRRPAIYEVLPGENLKTILGYAGGFTDEAYTASITLRRNTARERRIVNITDDQLTTFIPQRGDKYTIGKILERFENRVQITGAVMRPGEYALGTGITTVKELIQRAEGLRKDAFLNRGTIIREVNDVERENLSFDVSKVLKGEAIDVPLMRQDSVVIYSMRDLREDYYVIAQGAVNKPDTFPFISKMSVSDLILLAGGFQEGATAIGVEVARRIRKDSAGAGLETLQTFRFNLDRNLQLTADDARFALEPFDIVFVRTTPNYERQQQAVVFGEVVHPGNYAISSRNERIANLIARAGGLRQGAYLPGALFRRNGQVIAADLRTILLDSGSEENLLLQDGDTLIIPKRSEVVKVEGAVLNPSNVSYIRSFRLKDYIAQAGGFTDNARERKLYVVYPNGRKQLGRRSRIEPGTTIVVPFKPLNESRLSPTERIGILSLIGTLAATATTLIINLSRAN